jgi:dephospho-CoA kinase
MLRIGLTGGIGSGKSTVAAMLQKLGAGLVDADAISRGTTASGGGAIDAIRLAFGPEYIAADGALDRDRMRELAYRDPTARKRLEAIIHPLVGVEIGRAGAAAERQGCAVLIHDIPLLAESDRWRTTLDRVWVVDCPPGLQLARVMQRSALSEAQVQAIIATQSPRLLRLRAADAVLFNGSSLEALQSEVSALYASLTVVE